MLSFQVFTQPNGTLLADLSSTIQGLKFSTNCHGFMSCSGTIPNLSLHEQFTIYEWPELPHVVISNQAAGVVWEGRLEDISISGNGIDLVAFGYIRALGDVPYTALWSSSEYKNYIEGVADHSSAFLSEKFKMDTNNRLFVGLVKNNQYLSSDIGVHLYYTPDNGEKDIKEITFNYEFNGATNYRIILFSYSGSFASNNEWSVSGDGTLKSGSATITLPTARSIVGFAVQRISSDNTYTGETGDTYGKFTSVRIKTTDDTTILASDICESVISYINGINPTQISANTSQISATSIDFDDALFEDEYPIDFLDNLAYQSGFDLAVWENQIVHFKATDGRVWHIDAVEILDLERSIEPIVNSVYAKYKDGNGRDLRTSIVNDENSQSKHGIIRRRVVSAKTTSLSVAELYRDNLLADRGDYALRASVKFDRIYDSNGSEYPLHEMRAGDTVFIRNLPPTLSSSIDNIRSFKIAETRYNADDNSMSVEPAAAIPTLVKLVAGIQ